MQYQNEHNSVKKEIPTEMLFDYPRALPSNPAILKYFSIKCPVKEKKKLEKKAKKGGWRREGKR